MNKVLIKLNFTAIVIFSLNAVSAQNTNDIAAFKNWPKGTSPKEVGKRIADHFVETPHTNFNRPTPPKVITYPETCTWYGALNFAEVTGDKVLADQLAKRFEPIGYLIFTLICKKSVLSFD